jgi:hypothetical protein
MQMFVAIVAGLICLGGALGVVGLRNPCTTHSLSSPPCLG